MTLIGGKPAFPERTRLCETIPEKIDTHASIGKKTGKGLNSLRMVSLLPSLQPLVFSRARGIPGTE
jgi:hypothetical protein